MGEGSQALGEAVWEPSVQAVGGGKQIFMGASLQDAAGPADSKM